MYKLLDLFLLNKYTKNPNMFISDVKDLVMENLVKHKNTVDILNFKDIFDEVII